MESKKINQLATELAPELSDLTIIGDPTTGISKKITLSQMASLFTGTVEEYANLASFPLVGTADTIYIALDTNIIYRWNTGTSAYVELSPNIVTSLVFNDANGFDGTISLVGSTATLTITTALTQGSIGFIGASGALTQDNSNFFWDNTNKRLGINTNAPTTAIDAFGSGIIGRLNGTSTNNAFLGFASAGSNKWSIGNVQSDHRFRIYNEATTSELVSVLQTGEVGIGIANPLTKLHIFGGASALIANLDANTSVAKSISFRSGNSSRINLEVSGTESGSNAGANFYLRTYTDAGALLATPISIVRSTGDINLATSLFGKAATFTNDFTLANPSANTRLYINRASSTYTNGIYYQTNGTNDFAIGQNPLSTGTSDFSIYNYGTSSVVLNISRSTGMATFITSATPSLRVIRDLDVTIVGTAGQGIEFGALYNTNQTIAAAIYCNLENTGSTGNLVFQTRTAGSLTTKLSILSNGNVGIGTTSSNSLLEVKGATPFIRITDTAINSETGLIMDVGGGTIRAGLTINYTTGEYKLYCGVSGNAYFQTFYTNGVERMRIDQIGQTLFNVSSAYGAETIQLTSRLSGSTQYGIIIQGQAASYSQFAMRFVNQGVAVVGSITFNTTSTAYNTSSDYRLKEDFKDFNALDLLSKIKFYDFKWKSEDSRMVGVKAHELQEIVPYAVNGEKDGFDSEGNPTYQGVDYSKLVAIQGKAIQELKAEIELLKAK